MLATDVSAPEMEAQLCGRSVTLRFDHNAMRQAELYYKWSTQEVLGYYGIVDLVTRRTYCGLGALAYGAAAAAGSGTSTSCRRRTRSTSPASM